MIATRKSTAERPIIEVEGVSKAYRIGEQRTARQYLEPRFWRSLGPGSGSEGTRNPGSSPTFWALRDISFEVGRGEVLGIVGPNGAGKSTLLRILARITEPTRGRVVIRGGSDALLGVGTGFHSEFTGRENIYLKGAAHGLSRREIDRRFDEIVAFAGVERFLETPLKRYSSGMRARLGFALATTIESEILMLDEVFAVGDRQFKRLAREHIKKLASESARTVLIVSHRPKVIQQLCSRALFVENGRLVMDGSVAAVLSRYVEVPESGVERHGEFIRRVRVTDAEGMAQRLISAGSGLEIRIELENLDSQEQWNAFVQVGREGKKPLLRYRSQLAGCRIEADRRGDCCLVCRIDSLPLVPGDYVLGVGLDRGREPADRATDVMRFEVVASGVFGRPEELRSGDGPVLVSGSWRCRD